MKVLLYTENQKMIGKSGLGKAIKHQTYESGRNINRLFCLSLKKRFTE